MSSSSKNLIKPIVDSLLQFEGKEQSGGIQTKAFLQSCRLFLPVLDALGVAFKPAKSDVSGNVERLAKKEGEYENVSDSFYFSSFGLLRLNRAFRSVSAFTRMPFALGRYFRLTPFSFKQKQQLFDILLDEKKANAHAANTSCSKGLLWLKRFVEFVIVLVSKLAENQQTETKEAASVAYAEKLKPFHGWVSSSAFSVVLQFPPARKGFVDSLGGEDVLGSDGKELVEKFGPVLKRIDDFLTKEDLNDPTKV